MNREEYNLISDIVNGDEEWIEEYFDPTICECGDLTCHGCPSDEEFEAERDAENKLKRV